MNKSTRSTDKSNTGSTISQWQKIFAAGKIGMKEFKFETLTSEEILMQCTYNIVQCIFRVHASYKKMLHDVRCGRGLLFCTFIHRNRIYGPALVHPAMGGGGGG